MICDSVEGRVDGSDLAAIGTHVAAASRHRPTDEAVLAREAQKLAAQGLTERDVGQALQLDPTAVRRLLTAAAVAS